MKNLENETDTSDVSVHNEKNPNSGYAYLLSRLENPKFPTPIGIFRKTEVQPYEEKFHQQIAAVTGKKGEGDLKKLFLTSDAWQVD